jgi:ribonuclease HI
MLRRADAWLAAHPNHNQVIKWNTEQWGEIPADFGRK